MKLLCMFILLLTGCVNINVNHYSITYPENVKEEQTQTEEVKQETVEEKETVPPIIVQVPRPVLPVELPDEPEEIKVSFLDIVEQFKQLVTGYTLNYFTPISIYEVYGVNELLVEEFVGGNQFIENEIVEAVVLKAKEGQADLVYQKVAQRQSFLLAQYPDSPIVKQAAIVRNGNWIIYSVLSENQTLIDAINNLIDQT